MSIRFRRSIGLGKGIRLNINKHSMGLSAGVPGVRYSVNTSGRRYRSIGIPGTGLYSITQSGGRPSRRRTSGGRRSVSEVTAPPTTITPELAEQVIPRPGLFASSAERRFRDGFVAYLQQNWDVAANAFELAVAADTRNLSDDFFLGATYTRLKRYTDAVPIMERVVASHQTLPDALMQKYVPGMIEMRLPITERVTVSVAFDSVGASLVLAELYQELGRREQAIGVLQRLRRMLPDDDAVRLSLADLLYDDGDFKGLIELTQGVESRDDVTLATLHLRARALAKEQLVGPAIEELSVCLRRTAHRDPELLKEIRYNRAEAYELAGEPKKAKADWTKLVAADPFYRDARKRLGAS